MSNFKKNFIWNIIGTGFNSFNSLFLMIIVTRINGVDQAGIYAIAYATACILYIIGSYVGRVYQVTEGNKEITDKDYILNRVIACAVMMIAAIIFVVIRGYDIFKSSIFIILALYKAVEAISDVLYGILQKNDCLYRVGQSYFIKAIGTLFLFFIIDLAFKDLIISCLSILLLWIVIFILYDIPKTKKFIDKDQEYKLNRALKIFKSGFFVFAITFLGLYITNAPKYAIDSYLENSMQTIFGIITMPATAISLFGQFIFHPYLTKMSQFNNEKKYNELKKTTYKVIVYILGFGILASIFAYIIGIPVLNIMYGVDLSEYRVCLVAIIMAATLYNIGGTYSSMLTTMRKTFIQFIMYIIIAIIGLVLSTILTRKYTIFGATGAYTAIMLLYFCIYALVSKVIIKKELKKG